MEIAIPVPNLIGRLQRRLLVTTAEIVEEWAGYIPELSRWEDEHLLDNPTPELLNDHKVTLERCLAFGRLLTLGTAKSDFPDRQLAETVDAALAVFEDKLRLWHGPRMSRADSDRILAACFPNES